MKKSLDDRIARLKKEFRGLVDTGVEVIDEFIFTDKEEHAWFNSEPDFTKRIASPLPTKQR